MPNNQKYIKYKHEDRIKIDKMTIDKSKQLVNDFLNSVEMGSEELHIYEDAIYKTFIENLADKKITDPNEIQKIAKNLTRISKFEYARWYA